MVVRRFVGLVGFVGVLVGALAARAEDPTAIAREIDERFGAACAKGDVAAVVALYADDATAIFPSEGGVARGRAEIEKLAQRECRADSGVAMQLGDVRAELLSPRHISVIGRWSLSANGPDGKPVVTTVRTSELLVKTPDGWRFLVDHASVGVPPPAPAP